LNLKAVLIAFLMSFSLVAAAQTVTGEPPSKPATTKVEPKKVAPKKVATKKTSPPAKTAAAPKGNLYVNDPKAPTLLDKQGNAIPTNPNAYDVSSAVGKK
jgi:hypothetical protein